MPTMTITTFDGSKVDAALLSGKVYVLKTLTRRMTDLKLQGENWLVDDALAAMEIAAEQLLHAIREERRANRHSEPSEK
jgi:hypothetical protein